MPSTRRLAAILAAVHLYRYDWIGQVHLLQSRIDEAIVMAREGAKRRSGTDISAPHPLASAYALKGETNSAKAELAETRRLSGDGSYSSVDRLRA